MITARDNSPGKNSEAKLNMEEGGNRYKTHRREDEKCNLLPTACLQKKVLSCRH